MMKHAKLLIFIFLALVGVGSWYLTTRAGSKGVNSQPRQSQTALKPSPKPDSFNRSAHSIDDPNSIWIVVNKHRPLHPLNYTPADLVTPDVRLRVPGHFTMQMRAEAAKALEEMFAAARADGIELMLSSAFRSYDYQVNLYNSYVKTQGQAAADTESARPGYSEHQTGLAADLRPVNGECELEQCFGDMPEGKWVAANAYRFGFIIRYTRSNEAIAGYSYEPWHVRYVGKDLAGEMHKQGIDSLETFFNLPPAPDYGS